MNEPSPTMYRVSFEYDSFETTPQAAAVEAYWAMRDPAAMPSIVTVTNLATNETVDIDLNTVIED